MKKGDYVKLTKIGVPKNSPYPAGTHPNSIEKGYTCTGTLKTDIKLGSVCRVEGFDDWLCTSPIVEIISTNLFNTRNSKYKIELIKTRNNVSNT